MKMPIQFTSASAGSGKTYRIAEIISDRLGQRCRPSGLIATTYTVKAAKELRERVRKKLHDQAQASSAERLDDGYIGTVHSICGRLLQRFAFEAGISPELEVIGEDQAVQLLAQAIEVVADVAMIERLQEVADRMGQCNNQTRSYAWTEQVRGIIATAQANDVDPDQLPAMAKQSADELVAFLPAETTTDLDTELELSISAALSNLQGNGDDTVKTSKYVDVLKDCMRQLEHGGVPWSMWVKLAKEEPAKASKSAAQAVMAVAGRFEAHPRLRADIRDYTNALFTLAQRSLSEYRRLKEERGLLDFADLEQRAFHLLRDTPQVKEQLRQDLDLLVVDEFQDTSPIQLGIFVELAQCARETVWVGDVKQAIFGFRQSDPVLVNAVVGAISAAGGLSAPLANSYRAVPELVQLTNALFEPAFQRSLGIPANQVSLNPQRDSIQPVQPAVEFLDLSSGQCNKGNAQPKRLTNEGFGEALAERVAQWISTPLRVQDRAMKSIRSLELHDLAILCRTNAEVAILAAKLADRGLPVNLAQSGLIATPEARLALACLRRLADPADTLATAEIIALQSHSSPEEWLETRLAYVEAHSAEENSIDRWGLEPPFIHSAVQALEQAREHLISLSPSEALDEALAAASVFATVSCWGPNSARAAQRRANVEALRALVRKYEDVCLRSQLPATVAGFLFWCDDLSNAKADARGVDEEVNAIHVGTYHTAKGLEWPVVVCTELANEPRPRLWDLAVEPIIRGQPFDIERPLANRRLRFWAWPFGSQQTGIPLVDRVTSSEPGQEALRVAEQEDLRLLYVGLTRARDQLVIAKDVARPSPWLDSLEASWFKPQSSQIQLPDGTKIAACARTVTPPAQVIPAQPHSSYAWFPPPVTRSEKKPARLIPSKAAALLSATTGRIIDLGPRLPLTGKPDETDLGDALHAILAAEFLHPQHPTRKTTAERVLRAHGLESLVSVEDVLTMADRLRARLWQEFQPKSALVEVPFAVGNALGQRSAGFMDLLLETCDGWILIDHKSFMGPRSAWATKAETFSGQIACYRDALRFTGRTPAGAWIHFAVGGGLLQMI